MTGDYLLVPAVVLALCAAGWWVLGKVEERVRRREVRRRLEAMRAHPSSGRRDEWGDS